MARNKSGQPALPSHASEGESSILQRHYSPRELAEAWGFSEDTILRWFKDEPGVLRAAADNYNGRKRTRTEIRIPEDVARRVYAKRVVKQ